jgi:hypothetical protein
MVEKYAHYSLGSYECGVNQGSSAFLVPDVDMDVFNIAEDLRYLWKVVHCREMQSCIFIKASRSVDLDVAF